MKIGINGFFLTRPYTGFGEYTIGYLTALSKINDKYQYIVYCPKKVDISLNKNFTIKVITPCNFLGASLAKLWWEQFQIMADARKEKCDFVHHFYPVYSLLFQNMRQIDSIHDTVPWTFPGYNYSFSTRFLRKFIAYSALKADLILTVSATSQEEIIKNFLISPQKVKMIYNGYDQALDKKIPLGEIEKALEKYHIHQPYIFYLGGFDPRKNIKNLVLAFAKISKNIPENLILAGGVFSPQRKIYEDYYQLPDIIKRNRLKDRVLMCGPIETDDLPALYQGASFFVSPTKAEGFNIPVLQAFASGVAVACANVSATKEISSGSALMFNPDKIEEIADSLYTLSRDKKTRGDYAQQALLRAREFSWDKSARELLKIYEEFGSLR